MKPAPSTETDEDFWDLGDDDATIANTKNSSSEDALSNPHESATKAKEDTSSPLKVDPSPLKADPGAQDSPIREKKQEESSTSEVRTEEIVKDQVGSVTSKLSSLEKSSLIAVITLLVGAAIWAVSTFYDHAPEGTLVQFDKDFPLTGKNITVAEVETYWRKPIRKGENLDLGVQLNARLIPCARIKLSGEGDAALALSFRDSDKNLVGDPFSLEVKNGKFIKNNSNEIIVNCTAGFLDRSNIHPYINGDLKPWSLLIVEGDSGTTPAHLIDNIEERLLSVRIAPISISNEND